jgi:hypothetical protein
MSDLNVECLVEVMAGSDLCGELVKDRADSSGACVCSVGVLEGDSVDVEDVSLVVPEFPDTEEVSPEVGDKFVGPGCARVGLGAFAISVEFFLVVEDGLGNASLEKVLPADRLLVLRLLMERVIPGMSKRSVRGAEPLDDVLRDECPEGLSGVTGVVEMIQGDCEKLLSFRIPSGVWASQEMLIFFVDSAAVWASVFFMLVVSMDIVAGG